RPRAGRGGRAPGPPRPLRGDRSTHGRSTRSRVCARDAPDGASLRACVRPLLERDRRAPARGHRARMTLLAFGISRVFLARALRQVVERAVSPAEAVKAYHAALERARIRPDRSLADDLEVTDPILRAG